MPLIKLSVKSRVEATKKRAREESVARLASLIYWYQDLFRAEFAADPPVKVPPLKVQIKEGIEPVMARSKRCRPLHSNILKEHILSQEEHNLVYRNPDSRWGSAPRIVAEKMSATIE